MSNTGRIVWHDCMTTDIDTSVKFFTELFGWQVNEVPIGGDFGNYRMIKAGDEEIGGFVPLDAAQGSPSHWIAYVSVEDVAKAAEIATTNGGETVVPPTPIPNIGEFSVIKDPTGGYISPFKSAQPYTPETDEPPGPGKFCWEELLTNDPKKATEFYGNLFGWTSDAMEMDQGTYHVFKRGEKMTAGTMQMPPQADAPPHWLSYIQVDDVDAAAAKAVGIGGKQHCPPTDIPNMGRFAVLADPTGAPFAVFKGAKHGC